MDKSIPPGAAALLNFIGAIETKPGPGGYDTIYGHNQKRLPKPLITMTVDEVIAAGPGWTRAYGSSAAGRFQFMCATLKGLKAELGLRGGQIFDPNLQDRLGYHLLRRRGYEAFISGQLDVPSFARRLAMEWASLPVLGACKGAHRWVTRGQSYYVGDGLNKSLVKPEKVEAILAAVLLAPPFAPPITVRPVPPLIPRSPGVGAPPKPLPPVTVTESPNWLARILDRLRKAYPRNS